MDFQLVASTARHSTVTQEELTQYELVYATFQMRTRTLPSTTGIRSQLSSTDSFLLPESSEEEGEEEGGGDKDESERIKNLLRKLKEAKAERDEAKRQRAKACRALKRSEEDRRALRDASREAEARTATVMDVFAAQETSHTKTSMQVMWWWFWCGMFVCCQ